MKFVIRLHSIVVSLVTVLTASSMFAQGNFTWTGGGADNNWTTGANWGGTAPGSPQNNLNFAGATRTINTNNFAAYSAGYQLFFNTGATNFTLRGNPIKFYDFGGNRPKIQNDSSNTQTVDFRVGAGNAFGLDINANFGDIIVNNGSDSLFLDGGSQLRFDGSGGRTVTLNCPIIDGSAPASVAVRFNTTVIYNATNTYTAGTFLDAGQLQIGSSGALAGTITLGPTTGAADAVVYLLNSTGGKTLTNDFTIRTGGTGTLTVGGLNTSGENVFSGTITLQKGVTLSAATGGTVRVSGVINGAGQGVTIGKSGNTGTILYDNSMTYSGPTTVSYGTLRLNGSGRIDNGSAMTIANGATFDLNNYSEAVGSIAGSGNITLGGGTLFANADNSSTAFTGTISGSGGLTKFGTGVLTLSGTNTYTGTNTISAGTLKISDDSNLGSVPASPAPNSIVFNAAANDGFNTILAIGASVTLAANRGITVGTNGAKLDAGTNTLTINGDIANNADTNHLFILADGNTALNGSVSGTGDIVKQGLGTLTLNGTNNTFGNSRANIFFDKGVIQGASSGAFGATNGWIHIGSSVDAVAGDALLQLTSGGATVYNPIDCRYFTAVTTSNVKTIGGNNTAGAVNFAGNISLHDSLTIAAATGGMVKVSGAIGVGGGTTTGQATNNANILFTPGPGIVKTGAGTVEFSGANSFTGETYVKNGTLQFNGAAPYTVSTIRLGDDVASSIAAVNIANVNGGGAVNVTVNPRSGAGGTKTVSGSNVTGTNTFGGKIFLDSPLSVSSANAGATLAFTGDIFDIKSYTLTISGAGDTQINAPLTNSTGTGNLVKNGTGTLTLSGANTYSGNTMVNTGTLLISNTSGSGTGSGSVLVASSATLTGNGSMAGAVTLNGTISPGTSPGSMTTSNETWNGGAIYLWQINNATGIAGADPGWDKISINGALTLTAASTNKIKVALTSLTPANAPGAMANFDNTSNYVWTLVSTTAGITGFDTNALDLDTNNFANGTGAGTFSLALTNGGNDLVLRFTQPAVPPTITAQPLNVLTNAGQNAFFNVAATASGTLNYQWRKGGNPLSNGANISGATNAALTLLNVQCTDGGNYDAVVSNLAGSTNSNPATLSILETNATLTINPSDTNVVLSWTPVSACQHLQTATNIAGPWTDSPTQTNPQTNNPSEAGLFYRVISP